jgi:glutathione S-transferase
MPAMQLFHTSTSPFVRKVMVVAHELGLADRITTEFLRPVPTSADARLSATNPLSKIPALVRDDGTALYDSSVICEYLCSLVPTQTLLPAAGEPRWQVLRRQALASGMLDAGILIFQEGHLRPEPLRWTDWTAGQGAKVRQALDALEREVPHFGGGFDLGHIAVACAFGWLEFRSVVGDLRVERPRLSSWYDAVLARPSMQATLPRV